MDNKKLKQCIHKIMSHIIKDIIKSTLQPNLNRNSIGYLQDPAGFQTAPIFYKAEHNTPSLASYLGNAILITSYFFFLPAIAQKLVVQSKENSEIYLFHNYFFL